MTATITESTAALLISFMAATLRSKGIDKAAGVKREVIRTETRRDIRNGHGRGRGDGINAAERDSPEYIQHEFTAPATDAAKQWDGWGTNLKPAFEPICLARKPLSESTVAANVLKWGVGAINIDACRVGIADADRKEMEGRSGSSKSAIWGSQSHGGWEPKTGRWPANLCHDGSQEVLDLFPETKSGNHRAHHTAHESSNNCMSGKNYERPLKNRDGDSGSAARYFYCAKASKADRAGSKHPTVKPIKLIQWLVRLITPPGGTVLDPFAGSGTTGEAAILEGFHPTLIEREDEYCQDIERRMEWLEMWGKPIPDFTRKLKALKRDE